jgi:hypothetical protein
VDELPQVVLVRVEPYQGAPVPSRGMREPEKVSSEVRGKNPVDSDEGHPSLGQMSSLRTSVVMP